MRVLDLLQKVDWEGFFLVAGPSTSIDGGEVWGVADERGDNGTGASPGVVSFAVGRVGDMDGVEEGLRGVVGNETSWRDGILILGAS